GGFGQLGHRDVGAVLADALDAGVEQLLPPRGGVDAGPAGPSHPSLSSCHVIVLRLSNVHALTNKPTICKLHPVALFGGKPIVATDADILGREHQDDLDAILAVKPDWDATIRVVRDNSDTIFTWDYERSRQPLSKLYEKAKTSQWNGSVDLDWSQDVDQEK